VLYLINSAHSSAQLSFYDEAISPDKYTEISSHLAKSQYEEQQRPETKIVK